MVWCLGWFFFLTELIPTLLKIEKNMYFFIKIIIVLIKLIYQINYVNFNNLFNNEIK